MKIVKRLGLVAVLAGVLTLALAMGSVGIGNASTPDDPEACYCTEPALSLAQVGAYWDSYAAYTSRELSVDFEVHNNSANIANAHGTHVIGTSNTNGVMSTDHGRNINVVAAGECELLTMKFYVPYGVAMFRASISAETQDQCGNSYAYGAPMA